MRKDQPRLEISITRHLAPILRSDGFSGSGRTYRRLFGGVIHVVNVQGSLYGGKFAVNLAVQPTAILDVLGNDPDPKRITESLCEFRRRLAESGADQWWSHDGSQASMDTAAQDAARVYEQAGRRLFAFVSGSDSLLFTMSPTQFANGEYNLGGFGSTKARMALALARLRTHAGCLADARAFAEVGLAHVGCGTRLEEELKALGTPQ